MPDFLGVKQSSDTANHIMGAQPNRFIDDNKSVYHDAASTAW